MNNIDSLTGGSKALDSMRWDDQEKKKAVDSEANKTLSQEDFFSLMTQQLSYQDPFKPVDNQQMVNQMTSYSTLDAIQTLSDQFSDLTEQMTSNQALQASSLVGREVLVPVDSVTTDTAGQSINGRVDLSQPTKNVTVQVKDQAGQLIKTIPLGDQSDADGRYEWDGTDQNGKAVPPGQYSFAATGDIDGKSEAISVGSFVRVESVSLDSKKGPVVNLPHIGPVTMDNVYEIQG